MVELYTSFLYSGYKSFIRYVNIYSHYMGYLSSHLTLLLIFPFIKKWIRIFVSLPLSLQLCLSRKYRNIKRKTHQMVGVHIPLQITSVWLRAPPPDSAFCSCTLQEAVVMAHGFLPPTWGTRIKLLARGFGQAPDVERLWEMNQRTGALFSASQTIK